MQETQGDTIFVPKIRPTIKIAYVSIEVLTKSRVSFNPNPPKLPPRLTRCSLSIPTKGRTIQTSRNSTTILGSSQETPSHLGDWISKSNRCNKIIEGEGEVLLLESVAHSKGAQIFSQKNKDQELDLRRRERRAQALDLKSAFHLSESLVALGGSWGSIYSPHLKIAIGGIFHRTSPVDVSRS
jgi:hypothetical protein